MFSSGPPLYPCSTAIALWPERRFVASVLVSSLLFLSIQVNQASAHPRTPQESNRKQSEDQDASQQLKPGETVERVIKGREVHHFSVSLAANQYLRLVVLRNGIDLIVNVIAPDRSLIMKFENLAGAQSPIFATIKTDVPGTYTVEVRPKKKWLPQGRYEIHLEDVREPNPVNEKRLSAQQKIAEGKYEEALGLWREVGDAFQEANTLHLLARTYMSQKNVDKAEEYYTRTLERRGDDLHAGAYTLLDLAEVSYSKRDSQTSLSHCTEALSAFKVTNNRRGQALALSQIGLVYMQMKNWEGALPILHEALEIDRSEGDVYEVTRVLNSLGGVYDNQGQPEQAMELYEQAREGFHRLGDFSREGNMCINIGLHYDTWGEWKEAFAYYDRALDLLAAGEAAGDEQSFINDKRAIAFLNIAGLYVSLGSFSDGLAYLQKSLQLRVGPQRGSTLMWIGYTYVLSGEPKRSLDYCEQAIEIQTDTDAGKAQTYTVMGMALDALGMHERAVEFFDKALERQQDKKTLDLKGQAITLDKRGSAFAAFGELGKARADLETALVNWRTFKDRNGEALTLFHLATVERQAGNLDLALVIADAATKLIEPLRSNVMNRELRATYFASTVDYYGLYIDLSMQSRVANDVGLTTAAFEASERERARSLLDMMSDTNVKDEAVTDPTLGALLAKRRLVQRSILIKSAQQSDALLKESKARVAALYGDLIKLSAEQGQVATQLKSQFPRYAALMSSEPFTAKEIQYQLDDKTLLLEYSLGEKRSYVWAVTPDSIKGFELRGREEIESTALRLNKSLTERNRDVKNEGPEQRRLRLADADTEYAEASLALSKMVIEPVAALLGDKRLVIVADGALQLVSFGALTTPKTTAVEMGSIAKANTLGGDSSLSNQRSLIEDHEIVYQPSASVLALQRRELDKRKPAPLAVAVLADPVFDQADSRVRSAMRSRNSRGATGDQKQQEATRRPESPAKNPAQQTPLTRALRDVGLEKFSWLPYSREEAEAIVKLAPKGEGLSALGFRASRATATSSELSKYRIIHFATHGVVDFEHPELSGIVLSMVDEKGQPVDGYLRLHEIYNLNLPADLVVLSACQTGIGKQIKGEGLIALTRGFMYAGAQRVVASLWKVDDAATAELMAEFYKQMFTNHEKPAAALQAAQLRISQIKRWRSPYYWAGFVLQGEWK